MRETDLLDRLVENAIDFLKRSVEDLKERPKYSVIHFHAAVELFLKARLLAEHWSLVVAPKQEPIWKDFVSGSFRSVTLRDAFRRLDKAVESGLTAVEQEAFESIADHRNRMVHFFHADHSPQENARLVQSIAREQLRAWFFLHRVLRERWGRYFLCMGGGHCRSGAAVAVPSRVSGGCVRRAPRGDSAPPTRRVPL